MRGSLQSQLENLTSEQRMQVLQDVAKTLQKLYAAGIIHRDIKPSNILISEDGRGFLADIEGLRNYLQPEDPNDQIGTMRYIGRGPGLFGDIYALAVTTEDAIGKTTETNPFQKGIDLIKEEEKLIWAVVFDAPSSNNIPERLESSNENDQKSAYKELDEQFPIYSAFLDALANQDPNLMSPALERAATLNKQR